MDWMGDWLILEQKAGTVRFLACLHPLPALNQSSSSHTSPFQPAFDMAPPAKMEDRSRTWQRARVRRCGPNFLEKGLQLGNKAKVYTGAWIADDDGHIELSGYFPTARVPDLNRAVCLTLYHCKCHELTPKRSMQSR